MTDTCTRRWAIAAAVWVTCAIGMSAQAQVLCSNNTVWVRGEFGQVRFSVEVADNPQERALGLMHRAEMPASAGMLFVYPTPQSISFWMRNTLIALDMIFVDPAGVIKHIHHHAEPMNDTAIFGGDGLTHVLEIKGGLSQMLGITVGSQLRHPTFDPTVAAWPC